MGVGMNQLFYALSLSLLLTPLITHAATISGTVRDSEGGVISKARITIVNDPSLPVKDTVDKVVASDEKGQFAVTVVSGFYDVFVSAPAFSPTCTKVRVTEADPAIYSPRLGVDPLVIKESGDTFK